MKIYLLDDDPSVVNVLKLIISQRNIGEVCGSSTDPEDALDDLRSAETGERPDIVIVDLLMPHMDGITFLSEGRQILPGAGFIMLSQVSSKDMIASAYDAGCEFFIQKPVNAVEVENVINRVAEKLSMERAMRQVRALFHEEERAAGSSSSDAGNKAPAGRDPETDASSGASESAEDPEFLSALNRILGRLGVIGETGCGDIIAAASYIYSHPEEFRDMTVKELCSRFSDAPKPWSSGSGGRPRPA